MKGTSIQCEHSTSGEVATKASRPAVWLQREACYWMGLPIRWGRQMLRNSHDILRVIDLTQRRPMPAGLVSLEHPWVTGRCPESGQLIWPRNVIYWTPRSTRFSSSPTDDSIVVATGRFLAHRVRQSAVLPELPQGPRRRMPHAINYMHGSSHYNSGIVLLNDLDEGYRHFTDCRFRRELERFVSRERREILIVFRDRDYVPRDYAEFSCCLRTLFPWFCNPNGPAGDVLWGNYAPYAAANLITGDWVEDVYSLLKPNGSERVIRPAIRPAMYFSEGGYGVGRSRPRWPETLLAWANYQRVRLRGAKGAMFFVDRQALYADQIRNRAERGIDDRPQAEWSDGPRRTHANAAAKHEDIVHSPSGS